MSANREARRGGLIERVDRRKKRLEKRRRTEKEIEKERKGRGGGEKGESECTWESRRRALSRVFLLVFQELPEREEEAEC